MREGSLADLPWLAPMPPDARACCKAVLATGAVQDLARLAQTRLDEPCARALARALRQIGPQACARAGLEPLRLTVLSAHTFDLVAPFLPVALLRRGVALAVTLAPYGQIAQQAFAPDPAEPADLTLIAADHRWFGLERADLGLPLGAAAQAALDRLEAIVAALRGRNGAPVIVQSLPTPPQALFGGLDRRIGGTPRAEVALFNAGLWDLAARQGAVVFDVAGLAEQVGLEHWFNPVQWAGWKMPFDAALAPLYAEALVRLVAALRGRSRKCLVLDLDNTLWGGVLGDDGLDGLVLGEGSARGEAFLSVQNYARDLRARGILLAVSSRNEDALARSAFRDHPEMVLRLGDIAAFQANWSDKPANLEAIAATLGIGLEALVMLDDNPAERAAIRAALPMVAVPELPADPARYVERLEAAGYFEAVAFTADDLLRAGAMQADAERAEVRDTARSLGDYLAGLEMELICAPFAAAQRSRIVQLANKTNQFNLTTRRYAEAEIAAIEADGGCLTVQARLRDRFGDLGLISVVIARPDPAEPGQWQIETWLMSCRVLGREVERGVLDHLVAQARAAGAVRLVGRYRPSGKNGMVAGHYRKLGFVQIGAADGEAGSETLWALDLAAYVAPVLPFRKTP